MSCILIIDDEDKYYELCKRFMSEHEFLPPARNYREAAETLRRRRGEVDLVLLDVHFDLPTDELLPFDKTGSMTEDPRALAHMRRVQGLRILDRLRADHPDLPVIVMTSRADLPLESDAARLKAEDYTYLLEEDYLDARSLKLQIEGILARRERPADDQDGPFFWGSTARMLTLRRRLTILARGSLPIILQGATGTGKSLLAREFIHAGSGRTGAFVAVDLATIPTELMAAHLFGVVKGAYTGATSSREGVLGKAHGGTLFLDEIGNLGLELQKSLLQVLQECRYRPVGSVEERSADVKLVVATNENLATMVRAGRFREDLHMRLNPATAVTLPSLKDRRDDFDRMLRFFSERAISEAYNRDLVQQYAAQRGLSPVASERGLRVSVGRQLPERSEPGSLHVLFHPSSYRLLEEFDWPGNFRQLEMFLSNLMTLTLVELVDRVERIEPEDPSLASRPDVIPIPPRTIHDLLRPMDPDIGDDSGAGDRSSGAAADDEIGVRLQPGESLNAVSCDVERQYLEVLYERSRGDLAAMAERLLGDPGAGRKVQLRMNQLGIKLRDLRRRRGE